MILHRAVEAARRWADAHRELVIICVALPLSTAATAWQNIKNIGAKRSAPGGHEARLARVQAEVKIYAEARRRGEAWAPWRSYASMLLWAHYLDHPDSTAPEATQR